MVLNDRELMVNIYDDGMNKALLTASAVVVIVENTSVTGYPEYIELDTGLAAMAMVVQASDMDLGSVVLSVCPNEEKMGVLRSHIGLDESYNPMLMVAVGTITDENPDAISGASVENYNADLVHYNQVKQ